MQREGGLVPAYLTAIRSGSKYYNLDVRLRNWGKPRNKHNLNRII